MLEWRERRGGIERKRTGDVSLFHALLAEPFGEDVGHGLGRESDREGELGVVARHGGDMLHKAELVS